MSDGVDEQCRAGRSAAASGWGAYIDGENLTNRRDAVTESELGDAQFYRMPGRRVVGTVSFGF